MDEYDKALDLTGFHRYEETEKLMEKSSKSAPPPKNKKNADVPQKKWKSVLNFLSPILIALLLAGILRGFIFTNSVIPSTSMENTVSKGSRIVGSKLSYIAADPQRFDVIIFKYPDDESQNYIKRVIGLPGETVWIKNGKVYIDNSKRPLDDSFVTTQTPRGSYGPFTVPEGHYFVMGDNRNDSWDSRFWDNTYVAEEKIIAKAKFQYYPGFKSIE